LVLAGGLGTRLRPITNKIPKPLVKIGRKPTIAHVIDEIERNGINDIYVSIGYKAEMIESYLKNYRTGSNLVFIKEKSPLGTGGAVKFAMKRMHYKDIFMTYGDDLFRLNIRRMYAFHKSHKGNITMSIKIARSDKELSSSGVVRLDGGRVVGFVEKPKPEDAPSRFINIGKYIISTDIAKYFPKECRFSFERDFLQNAIGKINVYAYRTKVSWYPTDTFERLKIARSKWPVAR
ncbi:MAG: nucleotidyltransferase family protein, partial [Candidatus Micrarchaeia archaeon]